MSAQSNFWTEISKRTFHENVLELNDWNREPCAAEDYRCNAVQESDTDTYVLKFGEEQHLADHIAFLAQNQEGAKSVSAVMIEEDREGQSLTFRLAGNETPTDKVVEGLRGILDIVQDYAQTGLLPSLGFRPS